MDELKLGNYPPMIFPRLYITEPEGGSEAGAESKADARTGA